MDSWQIPDIGSPLKEMNGEEFYLVMDFDCILIYAFVSFMI